MVFGCLSKKHDRNSVVVDKPMKRKHTNLIYTDCFDKNIFIQNITSIFIILSRINTLEIYLQFSLFIFCQNIYGVVIFINLVRLLDFAII